MRVELYAEGVRGSPAVRQPMECVGPVAAAPDGRIYRAAVPSGRSPRDYTPRVTAQHTGLAVPLESSLVRWQR